MVRERITESLFALTDANPQLSVVRVREGDVVICERAADQPNLLMTFSWARTEQGELDPSKAAIYFNVEHPMPRPFRIGCPSTVVRLERADDGVLAVVTDLKDGFKAEDIIEKVVTGTDIMVALMQVPESCWREVRERLGYQYYDDAREKPTTLDFTRVLDLLRAPKKQIKIIS